MKRNAMSALMGWKSRSSRKQLLVYGARQVGKSYLIKEFAKAEFDDYVFLDLERQAVAREVFDGDLDPNRVISNIEQVTNHRIDPHRTLIFFDEIQAAPRALAALKYICEELPDSYVVAAGSLLGVAVNRIGFSAPVGKVETLTLLPMTFDEWLEATGHGQMIKGISEAYARKAPYPLHEQALDFSMLRTWQSMPNQLRRLAFVKHG